MVYAFMHIPLGVEFIKLQEPLYTFKITSLCRSDLFNLSPNFVSSIIHQFSKFRVWSVRFFFFYLHGGSSGHLE